ncbi:MAG: hypothetical protein LBD77_01780 [Bifidobacteriaceae bacterium]|jgi:hypothetical protein|nr:hypothetical protein [Bifidobacteriaceae bacterium]
MPLLDRRVQILFDRDTYDRMARTAAVEGRSVGSLVRAAVDQALAGQTRSKREALARLTSRAEHAKACGQQAAGLTLERWLTAKHDSHLPEGGLPDEPDADAR